MADGGFQEGACDEVRAPMCQLHNLAVEFYCQKHNKTACRTCKLMEHRKCQLQDIEHAAADTRASGRNVEVLDQLIKIKTHMEKIGEVLGDEKTILDSYKATAIEEIELKMKEIEALGRKKIAEVETIFKRELESLDEETSALAQSKVLVEKSIEKLDTATNVGSEEEIFVATKTAEHDVSKFEEIVDDSSHISHAEIAFTLNRSLADVKTIGDVNVARRNVTVDLTPDVIEIMNIQESDIGIIWFEVLPSDKMLLLQVKKTSGMGHLCLYSTDKKILSQLDLPPALSAATINDHQVILPLPDTQQLQIANIDNDNLTKGPVVKTDMHPRLILNYSDSSVLVVGAPPDGKWCFQILDLTGKVEKHITLNSTDLLDPLFMRINHERNAVYIIDVEKGCLGFNLNGDKIFHYTSSDYDAYFGLAVHARGALFFSAGKKEDPEPSCVIKLSPTGHELGQLDIRGKYPLQCIMDKLYMYMTNLADSKIKKDSGIVCLDV